MIIELANGWYAPVPKGYTVEQALKLLRDAGHVPTVLKKEDGSRVPIEEYEEAA